MQPARLDGEGHARATTPRSQRAARAAVSCTSAFSMTTIACTKRSSYAHFICTSMIFILRTLNKQWHAAFVRAARIILAFSLAAVQYPLCLSDWKSHPRATSRNLMVVALHGEGACAQPRVPNETNSPCARCRARVRPSRRCWSRVGFFAFI